MNPRSQSVLLQVARQCFVAIALSMPTTVLVGCSDPTGADLENVKTARRLLQMNKAQEALEALSSDEPVAEEHYLKAVALDRSGRKQPALGEIQEALKLAPDSVKYRGLRLRFQLFQKDIDAADKLIRLQEEHPSSAAVSLYCVYAYQAKVVRYMVQRKHRAAQAHGNRAIEALKTSIDLADEVPEFQREMLSFEREYGIGTHAEILVNKLWEVDPDSDELVDDKIAVLIM